MPPLLRPLILALSLITPVGAAAQEPSYMDDRSSPEALIRSLYNAIERKEFSRAYAYFHTPPAPSLDAYAEGYADTEGVEVMTGIPTSDAGAGSVYYSIPVAIRARRSNGEEQVFAGCYDLRLASPLVQTTPFTPLHIEKGRLAAAEEPLEDALPAACGDGPTPSPDEFLIQQARKVFDSVYGPVCNAQDYPDETPETHLIHFKSAVDPDGPDEERRLFRFFCYRGAYNEVHAYLLTDSAGDIRPLQFASPELDIVYEDDDHEKPVDEIRIIGYGTEELLVNSFFDPDSLTITAHSKWRGIGDASSIGTWLFRSGTFSLVKYEVDASYDGEIEPEVVLDLFTGP